MRHQEVRQLLKVTQQGVELVLGACPSLGVTGGVTDSAGSGALALVLVLRWWSARQELFSLSPHTPEITDQLLPQALEVLG